MSERDEFDDIHAGLVADARKHPLYANNEESALYGYSEGAEHALDTVRILGYRKPRTIKTAYQLEALPFGSAVQTSDDSDVVVLRCEGNNFRNQSGYELSATDLWRYGTQPFTVIYEPKPQS